MRLLTICPSRDRPELCKRMLDSFNATKSKDTEIIVYVADDDPQLDKYKEILNDINHIIGWRRSLVQVLNFISTDRYPGVFYYQEINDDHIYLTKGWDRILINTIEAEGKGWGIACANDLMTNEPWEVARHPSAAIISGNIVRTLGYFVLPELEHLYTDTYLRDIGEGIKALFRLEGVVIEHCHWLSNKAVKEAYVAVYDQEKFRVAYRVYHKWIKYQRKLDIEKLLKARDGL